MVKDYGVRGFWHLPSFEDLTDEELKIHVSEGCKGWVSEIEAMHWPEPSMFGGLERGPDGNISAVTGLQMIFLWTSADELKNRFDIKSSEANAVATGLKESFERFFINNRHYKDTNAYATRDDILIELLKEISDASQSMIINGVIIMMTFGTLAMTLIGDVPMPLSGIGGILIVLLVGAASFGSFGWLEISTNVYVGRASKVSEPLAHCLCRSEACCYRFFCIFSFFSLFV